MTETTTETYTERFVPGASEPWPVPRMTVAQALRRSWLLVILPAIVLAGLGAGLAASRPSTYTAEARLSVGKPDPSSAAFGSFVTATAGLASIYSRSISSTSVVNAVSKQLRLPRNVVQSRLSATPVQDSPVIRVIGKAPNAADAESIANAGADRLTSSTVASNRTNADSERLSTIYHRLAILQVRNAHAIERINSRANGAGVLSPGDRSDLIRAQAWGRTLTLRANAIGDAFTASEQRQAATDVLFPLSSATSASSNHSSRIQTLGGAGLLAGLVLGVCLAMWRAARLMARHRLMVP